MNFKKFSKKLIRNFCLYLNPKFPLIDSKTLYKLLNTKLTNIKILDCTIFDQSYMKKNAKELYCEERIPYSQLLDIDLISNKSKSLPCMLPNESEFNQYMKQLNINKEDILIFYDRNQTIYSSARAWFIFKIFGLENIYVLDGGYSNWKKEYETESTINVRTFDKYHEYNFIKNEKYVISFDKLIYVPYNIEMNITKEEIVDTRNQDRFLGNVEEIRPFRRLGTIKGSKNLYYKNFFDSDGMFKSNDELKFIFENNDIDINREIIFFSGIGISACVGLLAYNLLGKEGRLYDGGWAEFGYIEFEGNESLDKLKKLNNKDFNEILDGIISKMPKTARLEIETQRKIMLDRLKIRQNNMEYRLSKMKAKDDYDSPEEI